ncbi:Cobalamin (vitamin B12) biosynthesis CobI/CbiL,precorrin-2 C20-methyltransferase [Moorella glycerini]|uniref:Cobalt-precorrin-2 C(20)-methyltransferase n=1 Tax=Neomoorella stamsii TaxID=1266720 RepID=A0A9X7J1H9_9FIRM|nr:MULTISPECIES: precorrin-2 C(20)-methyltransferase [Moorella]PRR71480.1 Cobalt-precorrin-2 C(20)-methyltransferase [Moorella stamsii]CEP68691.1 Cobalamin (vitamin B12) biosynthesis CobI/CbiL,precorrin-2 C20-methyltransferase [Moorella glycerini]
MSGTLYGLGVGPGDPDLLTLKAKAILEQVPVLAVPVSQRGEESLALQVVRPFIRPEQKILNLFMPMTHDRAYLERSWDAAAAELLENLSAGQDIAFLTLGDASLYSTYSYLMQRLQKLNPDLKIVTVPGITSFAAAAASLNVPLAVGDEPLAIIPALKDPANLKEYLSLFPNLVLMKVARHYDAIVTVLEEAGVAGQSFLASRCGQPGESFSRDLVAEKGKKQDYLSLIIVKGTTNKGDF